MNEDFAKITGFTMDHLVGFLISVGIGFLIGLERQFSKEVNEKKNSLQAYERRCSSNRKKPANNL